MTHAPQLTTIRVLFVEDSPDDAALVALELARHGYRCESQLVATRRTLLDALAGNTWDIVLSDHSTLQVASLEALRLIRQHDPDLPFIIVSGTIGEDTAVDAMRAGAAGIRASPAACPEDRGGGPAGGWHRTRLQQPAHGHHGVQRAAP